MGIKNYNYSNLDLNLTGLTNCEIHYINRLFYLKYPITNSPEKNSFPYFRCEIIILSTSKRGSLHVRCYPLVQKYIQNPIFYIIFVHQA